MALWLARPQMLTRLFGVAGYCGNAKCVLGGVQDCYCRSLNALKTSLSQETGKIMASTLSLLSSMDESS